MQPSETIGARKVKVLFFFLTRNGKQSNINIKFELE